MQNEIRIQGNRGSQSECRGSPQSLYEGQPKPSCEGKSNKNIRYFSMFTGVGGFERGLERANDIQPEDTQTQQLQHIQKSNKEGSGGNKLGSPERTTFNCVGMSEIDKYSNQVLRYRFPNIKNYGDCTSIQPNELPEFDMLCGGFPCQSFSIAGKRRGFEDTRGTMFFEIARILEVKRPKIVLLENVKGLLNHDKGKTFSVILEALDELGYEVQWMVLNSKFHGVPQNRERVFIIGNIRGERRPEILPFGTINQNINDQNAQRDDVAHCLQLGDKARGSYIQQLNNPTHSNNRIYGEEGISPSLNTAQGGNRQPKIRAVLTPDRPEKRQAGRRFKEPGEPAFTITGQDIHGITDGYSIRRLTPTETCRLQGFPDDWNEWGIDEKGNKVKMSDTQRYKQMGNAVSTPVIKAIGIKLLKNYKNK